MMCACRFGEGQFLVDQRAEGAGFEGGDDSCVDAAEVVVGGVHEGHAANVGVAHHGLPRVDLDATAVADDDHSAVLRENCQILIEIHIREHLEDQVHPPALGQLHDPVEVVRRGVIQDVMSPFCEDQRATFFRAAATDDGEPSGAAELNGDDADTAGGTVDEDGFAGACFAAIKERAPGGGGGDAEGMRLARR